MRVGRKDTSLSVSEDQEACADIKAATSFKGDHGWFKADANVKKFRELIKVCGWFAHA